MIIYKNIKKNCKLVTGNSLAYELENYLNGVYKNKFTSNNSSLVIVLRKFWFYGDYIFINQGLFHPNDLNYFLNISVDCFLFHDRSYIPLVKKDTILPVYVKMRESERGTTIAGSLINVLNNFSFNEIVDNISSRKRLNEIEVNEYYDKNFHQPIINDTELEKGVYMSFTEFRKNAPSYTNFDVRKTKLADDIYLIEGKDTIPTRKAWGYCDGKNVYIKANSNLFELKRQDKSFAFMGSKKLTHSTYYPGAYLYNSNLSSAENFAVNGLEELVLSSDKFKLTLVPLHLDMETGEVY
jgi:hypothetical protein